MSPVEPRPVVIGTMGLPSTDGAGDFGFLPNIPAALNFAGMRKLLVAAPSAARNERRFQPNFQFIRRFLFNVVATYSTVRRWVDSPPLRCLRFQSENHLESTRGPCKRATALCLERNKSRRSCSARRIALYEHRSAPCRLACGCRQREAGRERLADG